MLTIFYNLCYVPIISTFLSNTNRQCDPKMALANVTEESGYSIAIMTAMLIVSGTGGVVNFYTIIEVILILSTSVIGTMIFAYLVADYSATLILADKERYHVNRICPSGGPFVVCELIQSSPVARLDNLKIFTKRLPFINNDYFNKIHKSFSSSNFKI